MYADNCLFMPFFIGKKACSQMPLRRERVPRGIERVLWKNTLISCVILLSEDVGVDVQLTDALKKYVNEKLGGALSKVGKKVSRCDVTLNVDKNPSIEKNQEIEIVLSVKGTVLRTKEKTHDMYASIDAASDSVKRKLRKYKEKIIDAHRAGRPEAADFDSGEIEVCYLLQCVHALEMERGLTGRLVWLCHFEVVVVFSVL